MSLKESNSNNNLKQRQGNWTNLPNNIKKIHLNKKHKGNSFNTVNYIDSHYNYDKILHKKRPPNLFHDMRSSSTYNFHPNNNPKNSLAFYPINMKIPIIKKSSKHIDNKRTQGKSPIDIIKIPKTNLNNDSKARINYTTVKMNTNKNKENKRINYLLSANNLTAKNINSGIFKKKIDKNLKKGLNNLSNSMTLINNYNKFPNPNSTSNIQGLNNTNINSNSTNKRNLKYETVKKEKERLDLLFDEKMKDSKKINDRIKELEVKNKILVQKINNVKAQNDGYASTLDKIIKLMKLLKNNGFDVGDILKNLSAYDNEETSNDGEEQDKKDENIKTDNSVKDFSFNIGKEPKKKDTNAVNRKEKKKKNQMEEFSFQNDMK